MSDAARMFFSGYRSALRRFGRGGARQRPGEGQTPAASPRARLFRKYVLLIVGLVGLVLLLNSTLDFWVGYEENKAALFRIQQEKATSAAQRIEGFVDEIERQLGWTTAPQWATSPLEQRRLDDARLLRQVPAITELIQLDEAGKEQLKVSRLAIDVVGSEKDYSQSPAFIEAKQHRIWFSPVYFRKESEPYMTVAMAQSGRKAGVTIAEVNLKLIWDVISALKIGQSGYAYVVDRDGRLIAHPDISLVLRNTDLSSLPQVAAALAEAPSHPSPAGGGGSVRGQSIDQTVTSAKGVDGKPVLTAHAPIAQLGWTVFVELPLHEALAPLYGSALRTAGLLVLALVLAALAALLLARRMTVPIRQLQAGAARIGAGELGRRIDIHTGDELEGLADDFNRMAADLQKSYADLEKKVEERTAELTEALDQQTATAEVLQVINSSPGDLAPVFDSMLEKAMRLCDAPAGFLLRYEDGKHSLAAGRGLSPDLARFMADLPQPHPQEAQTQILEGASYVHLRDLKDSEAYHSGTALRRAVVDLGGLRTGLAVPLLKDGQVLGNFCLARYEVRRFTDKQIALLQNFAAQAVIATENARLLTETREALEQQTATAEVLGVINSSPGNLTPVFDAMLEKAMRLCGAAFGVFAIYDEEHYRVVANHGVPLGLAEFVRQAVTIHPGSMPDRLRRGEDTIQVADITALGSELRTPGLVAMIELGNARTAVWVALRKDGVAQGFFGVYRQEVRPFTDKQVALLQNFAAQAVIAMENARLITETHEALEQQTATAEVLRVINSSPGDLAPVFDAMLDKAQRVCGVDHAALELYDGERMHAVAVHGASDRFAETLRQGYRASDSPAARALLEGQRFAQIADAAQIDHIAFRTAAEVDGVRTVLFVPLRRDDAFLGMIASARRDVRLFSEKEIALLENFAAQAVIAMENARLITETREALEQQTATAEVLQVINSSPGDLAPVFDAMLEKATRLCDASSGIFWIFDGEFSRAAATHGIPQSFVEYLHEPVRLDPETGLGRVRQGERVAVSLDLAAEEPYRAGNPQRRAFVDLGRARSAVRVPLIKDSQLLGIMTVYRQEVRPFAEKQIALLENFAAQAVIAMENARLITATREALEQQTATAEVLGVINSSPGDLAPVFDAILEKAHALCGAAKGSLVAYDGERYRTVASRGLSAAYAKLLREFRREFRASNSPLERLLRGESLVQIPDLRTENDQISRAAAEMEGARTVLFVPLRKDGALLGYMTAYRQQVQPFSDKQIALLQNFSAQAVIAMENARLVTETREALEQQTATAEVLQVINSSPGDLAPVFDAMLEKAMRLCEADVGNFWTYDGEAFTAVAMRDPRPAHVEWARQRRRGGPGSISESLIRGESVIHILDAADTDAYRAGEPARRAIVDLNGGRTLLAVALRKGDELLGYITIFRRVVRPFSDKQIALLQNFAAQAVIAMENARLITETHEALEQQTATAEVLQVINSSPGDLAPVFDAILEKAHTLCGATFGGLAIGDSQQFRFIAMHAEPAIAEAWLKLPPKSPAEGTPMARLMHGEQFIHLADVLAEDAFRNDPPRRRVHELAGVRTLLLVPLRNDGALLGALSAYRQEVRPFTDKQIALLQNFAAQAVIAIENARLITETREALEQQTATAEVLGVINSSPGDLVPVFESMLEKATRLCEAPFGILRTWDGERFHFGAVHGDPRFCDWVRQRGPIRTDSDASLLGRIEAGERVVHITDAQNDEAYRASAGFREMAAASGIRSAITVTLHKDDALLGIITVYRQEVRPFSDKQIALLENFAAQAVIAMENARLITETREALEQQTATAEVLQVINSSPGDLAPVFDAMLEKAHTLCGAAHGSLQLYDGEKLHAVATNAVSDKFADILREGYRAADSPASQALIEGKPFAHIADCAEIDHPVFRSAAEFAGIHTVLFVPLRKDGAFLGLISAARLEVRPFTEKEIALLQNFAAQAVIAMENARLINETREALEQQTATAEVLQVINSSPGDLAPVFDAIVEKALDLCDANEGAFRTFDGEKFNLVAVRGDPASVPRLRQLGPIPAFQGGFFERIASGERLVHIADVRETDTYRNIPEARERLEVRGIRTWLAVALHKEATLLGAIIVQRREVRPFSDKQIALLQNFAAQAVIAMENARLITELRDRTRDLQESLEYQTATSDVLRVISQSGAEIDSVLQMLVETAARLCGAEMAFIHRRDGEVYRPAASLGFPREFTSYLDAHPLVPGRGSITGRVALEGRVIHITDVAADPQYTLAELIRLARQRTSLGVPLLRDGVTVGVIVLARQRVEPFTEKEIELVRTFADQAVIAIENARLFNELRARTTELGSSVAELKMLSEVAQAVSSTLDLRTVLSTVLNASLGVTWANAGAVFRYSRAERAFRLVEAVGWDEALTGSVRELHVAETESAMGEAVARRMPIQLPDLAQRVSYPLRDVTLAAGFHSALIVPLVGAERILGAIILMRQEAGEFPAETVRLMQTIASQSVLAIQNARLFREIADKSEQLALASQHKSQFLANMSHELRTPLNAILGYAELLVDGIYGVLPDRPKGVLERIQNNGRHLLALINDVLDLAKIEAGQLTLTLEDYSLPEVVRSVVTATEPLATSKGLKFATSLQDDMPTAHGDARRVSQVLLNLVGNAIKFTDAGEVEIRASAEKAQFVLTVRDTGPGIAAADQDRIFGEFQQIDNSNTRKKGGTGLGLAISKRMVEMQGGTISVESVVGQGSTFRVVLPVQVEEVMEEAA